MKRGGVAVKVAAIQFAATGEPEANRRQAAQLVGEAAKAGACLVVLPEFWPGGWLYQQAAAGAETMRDASISLLRHVARERQLFIVGGSLAEKRDGLLYNTVPCINEAGEITVKYRQAHPQPQAPEEGTNFSHGDDWALTQAAGWIWGLLNGYDIYFPEFARNLALRGAQALAIPLLARENIGEAHLLAQARAVENRCFVILANQAGPAGAGQSLIVAPDGRILARAGSEDTVLVAELSMDALQQTRAHYHSLNHRRNILDEIDNSQL